MKKLIAFAALLALVGIAPAKADDLEAFGLEEVETVTDIEATQVRGQGAASTGMSAFQIFAFDYVSGSSLNLQASNVSLSESLSFSQGQSPLNTALIDTRVSMTDLSITIDGFSFTAGAFRLGSLGGALTENFSIVD